MTRRQDANNGPTRPAEAPGAAAGPSLMSRFLGGLSLGAFVGAAIAGSAIWDRWRRGDGPRDVQPPDGGNGPG